MVMNTFACAALAVACLVAAVAAQDPKPPVLPETFDCQFQVDIKNGNHTSFGEGRWSNDPHGNRAVEEFYHQEHSRAPTHWVLHLMRFDLHTEYSLNSEDRHECKENELNGSLPNIWGWTANATYAGKKSYHGREVNIFQRKFPGVTLYVGVDAEEPNVPVAYERVTSSESVVYFIHHFQNFRPDPRHFEVPDYCKRVTLKVSADPPRPNISDNFESECQFEIQRGEHDYINGEGRYGFDYSSTRSIEELFPHGDGKAPRRILNLQRYDLHEEYSIFGEDHDCHKQPLNGTMDAPWGWVAEATYNGTRSHGGRTIETWTYTAANVRLFLAVMSGSRDVPVFFGHESANERAHYEINRFIPRAPSESYFQVPRECQ